MKTKLFINLGIAACVALSSCSKEEGSAGGDSGSASGGPGIGFEGGSPLQTDLPKAVIEGSPRPKGVDNVAPETKAFPKFLVPEDAVLLSKGKAVTSSDDFPIIGEVEMITDGDKEAGEGYFVELLDGLQWVQIDLGKSTPIYAIIAWHFHSQKRIYHDVIIQVSNDPEFNEGVTTLYNNDNDNSAELGKGSDQPYYETRFGLLVNGDATEAQYVRLYSKGNTTNELNHYIEVEVWGKGE